MITGLKAIAVLCVLCVGVSVVRAEQPQLFGDGEHDDTAAIQARLDTGCSCVHLPSPAKEYLISKTLLVKSGQELRLDRFSRVRLAPHSDCPMVQNANWQRGDRDIVVSGGIWDYDNVNQRSFRDRKAASAFVDSNNTFRIFRFDTVERLTVKDLTFRNPTTYSCQLTRVKHFAVENIFFDFDSWSRWEPINMDGIHLDGGCCFGRISNLRGTCFDDMVALNANDGYCSAFEGAITDIDIDGLYSDFTHRGVRLLSTGAPVKRVTIRNLHLKTYRNGVALTHFFSDRPTRGVFDDIAVRDCAVSATNPPKELGAAYYNWPMLWVQKGCDVGRLTVDGFSRAETFSAKAPTVSVEEGATVERLSIRNCRQVNGTPDRLVFLSLKGEVKSFDFGEVSLASEKGAGENVLRLEGRQ